MARQRNVKETLDGISDSSGASSSNLSQSSSLSYARSQVVEWKIRNFAEEAAKDGFKSRVTFKVVTDDEEFGFKLQIALDVLEDQNWISLCLVPLDRKFHSKTFFGVLSESKEKMLTKAADKSIMYFDGSREYALGNSRFCLLNELLTPALLPNGSLTVLVEFRDLDVSPNLDLVSDLAASYEWMEHADVELRCEGESFPCHKFMLGARSDVFRAMFDSNSWREAQMDRVEVEEASAGIVGQFVRYVYTDRLEADRLGLEGLAEMLNLAEKYNVRRLKEVCAQGLLRLMDERNAVEVAKLGDLFGIARVRDAANRYMRCVAAAAEDEKALDVVKVVQFE